MATWSDVKTYIHETFKVDDLSDEVMKMVFETGDLRSQLVFLTHYTLQAGAEDWVAIESPFAEVGSVDLDKALEEVGNLVCGGLSRVATMVTLKHSIPLANLNINELQRPLALVVNSADTLEKKLVGGDRF
jgi:hypothetical protein